MMGQVKQAVKSGIEWAKSELRSAQQLSSVGHGVDIWLLPNQENALYQVGFAASGRCLEAAQRLRYEVFNLELNEGLMSSHITGLDRDEFDDQMTHIVVFERASGRIVGTYRLQLASEAMGGQGLYSAQEYDLSPLAPSFEKMVELGRACIDREHRSLTTLMLLWRAIADFVALKNASWMFGCCSLTSLDSDDGWRAMKTLRSTKSFHPDYFLQAQPAFSCGDPARENEESLGDALRLPKLFRSYLRLGTQVISEPAIDREFGTVDFLILGDIKQVNMSSLVRTD